MSRLYVFLAAAVLAGCAHPGPKSVAVDRFDYGTAFADSCQQQTLLDIIKIGYADLPRRASRLHSRPTIPAL